jgi:hypothetical protein
MTAETSPRFAGIGGHHSHRSKTDEWATPPAVIEALGGWQSFDLDPCAMILPPFRTAARTYTKEQNGLIQRWFGRVYLNPPYSMVLLRRFMARMALHNHGIALIFARTETETFHRYVWETASACLFIEGRLCFHKADGSLSLRENGEPADAGAPSVLCAYGARDADILSMCGIAGQFVPLRIPRLIAVMSIAGTWREIVMAWLASQSGPVALADLYRALASHPKAQGKQHYQAKIRQVLQQGAGRRVRRGQWAPA